MKNENNSNNEKPTITERKTAKIDQAAIKKKIVLKEPKNISWRKRRLYWTLQERIAYDLVSIALTICVIYLIFHFIIGAALVHGNSMYPTLKDGQLVVYNRLVSAYNIGDVVSVRMPSGEFYVKRIIAKEGDVVDLKDGKLYVNGVVPEEQYVYGTTQPEDGNVTYPLTVEAGKYFILGDNRGNSNDSRAFGTIIKERITGKVMFYAGTITNPIIE